MKRSVAVLMYHELSVAPPVDRYGVSEAMFEEHLSSLARAGLTGMSFARYRSADASARSRAVVLTFDDGYDSDARLALPILLRHGFSASFFITTGRMGEAGRISAEQVEALRSAGMEIGTHGHTHTFLDSLPPRELVDELAGSRRILAGITGDAPTSMSLPGGRGSGEVLRAAKAQGYALLAGSVPRPWREPADVSSQFTGRYAVTRGMSGADVSAIARGDWRVRAAYEGRYFATALAKRILGNALYHRAWVAISRGRRTE